MNKRQAKKQYKKIHGHNPPKTAVTKYTPEEMEAMKVYNLTPEDIERIGNGLRDAFAEMFKTLQRVAESMARVFEDMGKKYSRHQRAHGHDIYSKRDGRCAVSGGRLDVGGQQYEKCKGIQSNPGRNL